MGTSTSARAEPPLERYWKKRDFSITAEPRGTRTKSTGRLRFVIQKHAARRLHYDFRLELDGVLVSWAVPKGPSFDPADKRLAVHVEDHPVSYGDFEGKIPEGQYGAGDVIVWDRGEWEPIGDPRAGMAAGKLVFRLHGQKLAGAWELIRLKKRGNERQESWLLFKKRDEWARPGTEYDVITALPDSVIARPLGPREARDPPAAVPPDGAPARSREAAASSSAAAVSSLPGAVAAPLPARMSPQLATLWKGDLPAGDWSFEVKFDGYRVMARIDDGQVALYTRGGHDWTSKMAPLAAEVQQLGLRSGWIDGEVVVLDAQGRPDFNALQNAFDASRTDSIVYFVFDAPFAQGHDLRRVPLRARREWLRQLVGAHRGERVMFSEDFAADALSVLESACALGLEGVIAKRADGPYVSDRTSAWLKLKCTERQELVVGGFTERRDGDDVIGGLMLGYHDARGRLVYAGNVGTGWNAKTARELRAQLAPLVTSKSPFADPPSEIGRGRVSRGGGLVRWVKPKMVVEVEFAEWTPDGRVRHAAFRGVRADKPASQVRREVAAAAPEAGSANDAKTVAKASPEAIARSPRKAASHMIGNVKVSHPERVIDAKSGLTKLDLVRYYQSVAEWMLPHLKGRPVSLVRGPGGVGAPLFFQKHPETKIPGITELDPALWPEHAALMEIGSEQALVSAAQMNTIEFHTWNSRSRDIDRPDRMIFDLDPGEGTSWERLQDAALLMKTLLDEIGLASFLKTSGGKGLHVVVPIAPREDWDTVKGFTQALVVHLSKTFPDRFVAKPGASNRVGRIFVDYLRNAFNATTAAAFSARSRPGLGVSMPVSWDELPRLTSGAQWTIATACEHLSFRREDPWAAYWKSQQTLTRAMRTFGYPAKARTRR